MVGKHRGPRRLEAILRGIGTGRAAEVNRSVKEIEALCWASLDECFGRRRGGRATAALARLRDEFMRMCRSPRWQSRYGGLRGLGALRFSRSLEEKIGELHGLFLAAIVDGEARVRLAAANALAGLKFLRGKDAEDAYAALYIELQEMFDEYSGGKRRSIGFALERMTYPDLDRIMAERGFFPAGAEAS